MKVIATHDGFAPGTHEGIRESIEAWAQQHLEPVLASFKGDHRLLATIKRYAKGAAKYSVTLRMHLPRKHVIVAHGENTDIHAALSQGEQRLLREVIKYKDRLHNQADYRRKARRTRLRELKAAQAALAAKVAEQARGGIELLLPQIERVMRRELAYLRHRGELSADYPTVQDVVDEAVLAVSATPQPGESTVALSQQLLRAAFKALDAETEASRRYGEMASLENSPGLDADDQAEVMVEEEIFEYYQPDEALWLSDVLPDETVVLPDAGLEAAQREFSLETLGDLPMLWRRAFMLAEFEHLAAADIAEIMEMELVRVKQILNHAQAFLHDHLRQAGFSYVGERPLAGLTNAAHTTSETIEGIEEEERVS